MTERGPLQTFEITWSTGHVETIQAHQVHWPDNTLGLFGEKPSENPRVMFHGEFDGHWTLVLVAFEADITRIRNVTVTEPSLLDGEVSS